MLDVTTLELFNELKAFSKSRKNNYGTRVNESNFYTEAARKELKEKARHLGVYDKDNCFGYDEVRMAVETLYQSYIGKPWMVLAKVRHSVPVHGFVRMSLVERDSP